MNVHVRVARVEATCEVRGDHDVVPENYEPADQIGDPRNGAKGGPWMTDFILINQGEHAVSSDPDVYIQTLLGSCVGCAMWDPLAGIGGMNHVLLPSISDGLSCQNGEQVNMMEMLINGIQRAGGNRRELRAKVFGGAQMIEGLSKAGATNLTFVDDFLMNEEIPCLAKSIGGDVGRRIQFWPASGRVRLKIVRDVELMSTPTPTPKKPPTLGGLELF